MMDQVHRREDTVDGDSRRRVRLAAEVFRKHGREIRAMIQSLVRDQSQADDFFQNLFLSLVARPLSPNVRNVKRYLYRAIINDVISHGRRERCRTKHIKIYAVHQTRPVVEEDPQDGLIRAEQLGQTLHLVEHLRPTEAQAVIREYALADDRDRASSEMGVKRRSFSKYLSRGMRKLRFIALAREGEAAR